MAEVIIFDMRELEHPKPLEIMTKALNLAQNGKILKMIHRREPFPLYEIIRARALEYKTFKENEDFVIYIAKKEILEKHFSFK